MKQPILIIALGVITGIFGELYLNIVPFVFLIIIFIFILLKILNLKFHQHFIHFFIKSNIFLLFSLSAFISSLYLGYCNQQYEKVYHQFEDKEIIATIISDKKETEYRENYTIKLENSHYQFLLRIPKNNKINLKYGDKIKIDGEYSVPESARNYGGFDYRQYLKTKKIYGIFDGKKVERLKENNLSKIEILSNKIKQDIIENSSKILPKDTKELFLGILIGYDDNLQEDIQESFRKSSLSHLLAVSGAHISYIIMGCTYLLSRLKVPKKLRNILIIFFLYFFMFLTSFSASVVRASIMGIIMLISFLVYRRYNIQTAMSITILFILADNPYKILDIGLLLSYFATIGILIFSHLKKNNIECENRISLRIKSYLKEMILITLFANVFVMPIILYTFNTISLNFILSNLVAGMLIGPITIGGFILILFSFINIKFAYIVAIPYNLLLKILIASTNIVGKIPYVTEIILPTPSIFFIILYYFTLFLLIIYYLLNKNYQNRYIIKKIINKVKRICEQLKRRKRDVFFVVIFFFIVILVILLIPKDLKIYFIDVGQGDSTLIITPMNKKILIDSGGQESGTFDVGKSTLVPYLLDRGIKTIDYICISHFDSDHCQGFIYLLNNLKVKNIIFAKQPEDSQNLKEILKIVKEKKINIIEVKVKDKIILEKDITIQILWPDVNNYITENILNNNSMVCKLCYKNFSILFTGDIEESAEKEILQIYKNTNLLKSTILKVAHHGSKTSSTEDFLKAVNPQIALIGVGKNNKFGHPNEQVIRRLQENRVKVYRTDINGEINIKINHYGKIKIDKKH